MMLWMHGPITESVDLSILTMTMMVRPILLTLGTIISLGIQHFEIMMVTGRLISLTHITIATTAGDRRNYYQKKAGFTRVCEYIINQKQKRRPITYCDYEPFYFHISTLRTYRSPD